MQNIGYLNFSVTSPTLFSFVDAENTQHSYDFDPQEPQSCIEAVAALIQQHGLTRVICNKTGFGLCGSISAFLKSKYSNNSCTFELDE